MSPVTHFLFGWLTANASTTNNRRERAIITLAGVAPDIDGLGLIADVLTRNSAHPLNWFSQYHHLLGHNLSFCLILVALAMLVAKRKLQTAALVFLSFHLHLLCDLVGSRSPDGYQWPIAYLFPFSNALQLTWSGQWELNAWQNFVITGIALIAVFTLAVKRGFSPLEMISESANRSFVNTLRRRFSRNDNAL
jgi:inner membrane protein